MIRTSRGKVALLPKTPKLLVCDFDGVFTDNRVLVHQDGSEAVWCNRADGLGIALLLAKGISVIVLSMEENPVVSARCRKLGVPCYKGVKDKYQMLQRLVKRRGVKREEVIYLGNDVNDLPCMEWVGCGVAVQDAVPSVLSKAKIVLTRKGGEGAVRELCDLMLQRLGE